MLERRSIRREKSESSDGPCARRKGESCFNYVRPLIFRVVFRSTIVIGGSLLYSRVTTSPTPLGKYPMTE